MFRAAAVAVARIDLREHRGVHRRIGALDVCPFVPLRGVADMPKAVDAARRVGERLGGELDLPVYLYGEVCTREERRVLGAVRNLGFETLSVRLGSDPELDPDFGPARVHPTAGAVAVGARRLLIAFNVDLDSADVAVARRIARAVRSSDGGLPAVQAMGIMLAARGCTQVSMNLLDFEVTSVVQAFDRVAELARDEDVAVRGSELIGLAPAAAIDPTVAEHVQLAQFDPGLRTVEERLRAAGLSTDGQDSARS